MMTRRTAARPCVLALAALPLTRLLVQPVRQPGRSDQGAVGAGREPAAAPQRPDPEPGRDGQGLRRSTKKACSRRSPTRARGCWRRSRPKKRSRPPTSRRRALGRLLAIVENYPQLKANEQFNRLMDELSGTENRIAVERMRYNERVQEYNTSRAAVPGEPHGEDVRLQGISVLRGAARSQAGAEGELQ